MGLFFAVIHLVLRSDEERLPHLTFSIVNGSVDYWTRSLNNVTLREVGLDVL